MYRTGTEPYRTGYIRYRYPLLGIFDTGIFSTKLIPIGHLHLLGGLKLPHHVYKHCAVV
ncbi:hypothetical protein Hanom_Chr09g00863651 [Helianthus anomalus]